MYAQPYGMPMQAPGPYGQASDQSSTMIAVAVATAILIIVIFKFKPSLLVSTTIVPPGSLKIIKFVDPEVQTAVDELQVAVSDIAKLAKDEGCMRLTSFIQFAKGNMTSAVNKSEPCLSVAEILKNLPIGESTGPVSILIGAYLKLLFLTNDNFCKGNNIDPSLVVALLDKIQETLCEDPELLNYIVTDVIFYATKHLQ